MTGRPGRLQYTYLQTQEEIDGAAASAQSRRAQAQRPFRLAAAFHCPAHLAHKFTSAVRTLNESAIESTEDATHTQHLPHPYCCMPPQSAQSVVVRRVQ